MNKSKDVQYIVEIRTREPEGQLVQKRRIIAKNKEHAIHVWESLYLPSISLAFDPNEFVYFVTPSKENPIYINPS